METKFVSIDSSTNKTGMSLFINGELQESKLIDLSKGKMETGERINVMGANIIMLLSQWDPDIVYIEVPQGHGKNVLLVRMLSEILGIARGWCIDNSRHFEEVAPSVWRSLLGFKQGTSTKRTDLKRESVEYVRKKYNILVNDDVADSICIGNAMIERYRDD